MCQVGVMCVSAVYCAVGRCTAYYGDVLCVRVAYCLVGQCTVW